MYIFHSAINHCYQSFLEDKYSARGALFFYRAWNIAYHILVMEGKKEFNLNELIKRNKILSIFQKHETAKNKAFVHKMIIKDHLLLSDFVESGKAFLTQEQEFEMETDVRDHPLAYGVEIKKW